MTDFQDDLREALATRAANLRPGADLGDLTLRMVRRERRKGAVLALVLVGVVGAGVVAVDATRRSPLVDRAPNAAAGPARSWLEPARAPRSRSAPRRTSRSAPLDRTDHERPGRGHDLWHQHCGGIGTTWMAFLGADAPLGLAFTRTTASGATIRVYRADLQSPAATGPPWWTPPNWCSPSGIVQADLSTDAIAGVSTGFVYAALHDATVGGAMAGAGVSERHPTAILIVQAPPSAASVRVTFPGGVHDEMAPVDGVAVLVGAVPDAKSLSSPVQAQPAVDASGRAVGEASIGLQSEPPAGLPSPAVPRRRNSHRPGGCSRLTSRSRAGPSRR